MIKLLESKDTRRVFVVLLVAVVLMGVTAVAYAITITVDGVREAAWSGSGGQTPGSTTDLNEGGITDGYDMQEVLWTNGPTDFYFLIQTYAPTIWTGTPFPTIIICLDTDNNTGTGGTYSNCNSMSGIDRTITINRFAVEVYNGDPNTGTLIGTAVTDQATVGDTTEISIDLASLGMVDVATCSTTIPMAIYFDNGIVDPDDNTPDAGTINIGCGGPTAVTLQNISASGQSAVLPFALGAFGLIVVSTGLVISRERKNVK